MRWRPGSPSCSLPVPRQNGENSLAPANFRHFNGLWVLQPRPGRFAQSGTATSKCLSQCKIRKVPCRRVAHVRSAGATEPRGTPWHENGPVLVSPPKARAGGEPELYMRIPIFIIALTVSCAVVSGCGSGSPTGGGGGGFGCEQSKRFDANSAEVDGYIESKSTGQIVVFNTVVIVTDSTEIRGEDVDLEFNDLVIGMCVEADGTPDVDRIIADRIRVRNDDG